ncbi:hypothetical protein [Streptomyces virginiae]
MNNPLADAVGELSDAQLRRIVALLGLRRLPAVEPVDAEEQAA